jgi:hypothetical protein
VEHVIYEQKDKTKRATYIEYITAFFGVPQLPDARKWEETVKNTKEMWITFLEKSKDAYNTKSTSFGLKDKLSSQLIELVSRSVEEQERIMSISSKTRHRVLNPFMELLEFDGGKDSPVEILHVILLGIVKYLTNDFLGSLNPQDKFEVEARLQSFNIDALNLPPIQASYMIKHYGSFIGKDYRLILQVAPFVFFPLMTEEQKDIWIPLCHIGSMAFQTKISRMAPYIEELKVHINVFLHNVSKMSAQWVNKPKFHMLLHLPDSIERFGNASLFATEKFESYNSILRNSSIHSNRLSPSRDIAISFSNYQIMRLILSGAHLYNHSTKEYFQPSANVTKIFQEQKDMQKSLGFNPNISLRETYPRIHTRKVPEVEKEEIPIVLQQGHSHYEIRQIASIKLNQKEIIRKGSFVLVNHLKYKKKIRLCMMSIY